LPALLSISSWKWKPSMPDEPLVTAAATVNRSSGPSLLRTFSPTGVPVV
jgi:hypothetical protein